MRIGVLALQGDFSKHIEAISSLGIEAVQVRKPEDLAGCDGLIIPGGESTVMLRLIDLIGMRAPLLEFAKTKGIFGTCAGLILLSKTVSSFSFKPLGLIDITIERNAYGSQVDSFQASVTLKLGLDHSKKLQAFFIRAPQITCIGKDVSVLATWERKPVLVRQGRHLGAAFHPELTSDNSLHAYFLELLKNREKI